jgi:hypothetical protein
MIHTAHTIHTNEKKTHHTNTKVMAKKIKGKTKPHKRRRSTACNTKQHAKIQYIKYSV